MGYPQARPFERSGNERPDKTDTVGHGGGGSRGSPPVAHQRRRHRRRSRHRQSRRPGAHSTGGKSSTYHSDARGLRQERANSDRKQPRANGEKNEYGHLPTQTSGQEAGRATQRGSRRLRR